MNFLANELSGIRRPKVKIQNNIICTHCGEDSFWRNDEISEIIISREMYLKCGSCQQNCIHLIPRDFSL